MNHQNAQEILDKIMGQIFGVKNPYSLAEFMKKFAFDIRLPLSVQDSTTGEDTWASSANPTKYVTQTNAREGISGKPDWLFPKEPVKSIDDILQFWDRVNYTLTDRHIESENVLESDTVIESSNVYRSQDVIASNNVVFTDGAIKCEFVAAQQRANNNQYCARVEDSQFCSNSFSVNWSKKISNCFFIQDCADMYESMFCAHIRGQQYCIANMQFEKDEYFKIKEMVIGWILSQ